MRVIRYVVFATFLLGAIDAWAQAVSDPTTGEVVKIEKAAKKIMLKHAEIKGLDVDMPPMTMVFRVKDPALLDKVKVGDKVKFRAENKAGALTVIEIQPAK